MHDMTQTHFKVEITSKHKLFDLHLRETLRYRDLIFLFVKRDFISLYKQTVLGPLWALIQPLMTTLVFTVVFGNMARLTTADTDDSIRVPAFLFYMAGSICWTFFSSVVSSTSGTFLTNARIMGKVYYPRLVSPVAAAFSQLISYAIQLGLFFILWGICLAAGAEIRVTPRLLLIPLLILHLLILSLGCGIVTASVTTKYRDLMRVVSFGLQLWHYATPIAYGLKLIPGKMLGWYMLNPVTPVITAFRYAVFGSGYFDIGYYMLSLGVSIGVFFAGLILFGRIERTFTDTI